MRHSPLTLDGSKPVYSDPDDAAVLDLRARLLDVLGEAEEDTVIPVSVAGSALSASCWARLLSDALKGIATGAYPGRYVVLQDLDAGNDWDADAALRKVSSDGPTKLVCVWRAGDGRPRLIGDVDRAVRETYDFVVNREAAGSPATARELAEAHQMRIQAASNRITKSATLGVVRTMEERPKEGPGGPRRLVLAVQ